MEGPGKGWGQGAEPGAVGQQQTLQVQGWLLALKGFQRVELVCWLAAWHLC